MSIPNSDADNLRTLIRITSSLDAIENRGVADDATFEFCRLVQDWIIDHWNDGPAAELLVQHIDSRWGDQ